jgi:hypothetical protein
MKTIVRTYTIAAAVLAVASLTFVAAAPRNAKAHSSAAPSLALAMDCCDDPPPCGLPGYPPCPDDSLPSSTTLPGGPILPGGEIPR